MFYDIFSPLHEELDSRITLNYTKAAHIQALQSLFINFLKPTGCLMHQQVLHSKMLHSVHTVLVFMRFVFISEQTATFSLCDVHCLIFTTVMRSVYCAVGTGT
jgi:hypothetical protein